MYRIDNPHDYHRAPRLCEVCDEDSTICVYLYLQTGAYAFEYCSTGCEEAHYPTDEIGNLVVERMLDLGFSLLPIGDDLAWGIDDLQKAINASWEQNEAAYRALKD